MSNTTIMLGDTKININPITLGMMRKIGVASLKWRNEAEEPTREKREDAFYASTFEIISLGTGLPVEEIEKFVGVTFEELVDARNKIIEASGLKFTKEELQKKMGEATGA